MTTDWGDNSHPNMSGASWYGYAYGGSEGWAHDLLTPLRGIDLNQAQTLGDMRFVARQIIHAARKTRAGRQMAALADEDTQNRRQIFSELVALKHELHDLRWEYQRLWLARNNPEGIWLSLDLFDSAAHVLDRWRNQVAPPYEFNP